MAARRLDINSLLCTEQNPVSHSPSPSIRPTPFPHPSPVLEPVILAPHLCNPHARSTTHPTFPVSSTDRPSLPSQPASARRVTPTPPILHRFGNPPRENQSGEPRPSHPFIFNHEPPRLASFDSIHHTSHRLQPSHSTDSPYQNSTHSSPSSRSHSHSPAVPYPYPRPPSQSSRPHSFSPPFSSHQRRTTSPLPFHQGSPPALPVPSSSPPSQSHRHPPFHHTSPNPNLRSDSNTFPSSSPIVVYPPATPSSLLNPLPSSSNRRQRPFVGLEALMHAASEERRKLSGSTNSPSPSSEVLANTGSAMDSTMLRSDAPRSRPSPRHRSHRSLDKILGEGRPHNASPTSGDSSFQPSPFPPPHYLSRESPVVDLKEKSDVDAPQYRQRRATDDNGSLGKTMHATASQHRIPGRIFPDDLLSGDSGPMSLPPQHSNLLSQASMSHATEDSNQTALGYRPHNSVRDTGNQPMPYANRPSSDYSSDPSRETTVAVRNRDAKYRLSPRLKDQQPSVISLPGNLNKIVPPHHPVQERNPTPSEPPVNTSNRRRRRRRASSPNSTNDARLQKKRRWSDSHSGPETTGAVAGVLSGPQPVLSIRKSPTPALDSRVDETCGGSLNADVEHVPRKISVEFKGEHKLNSSDRVLGDTELPREDLGKQHELDADSHKDERLDSLSRGLLLVEGGDHELIDRPRHTVPDNVAVGKPSQDPHEWLLEHYAESPPTCLSAGQADALPSTNQESPRPQPPSAASFRPRTPDTDTAVADETEPVIGNDGPAKVEIDVDIANDLVAETSEAENDPGVMDVDEELLSLVDDRTSSLRKLPPSQSLQSGPTESHELSSQPTARALSPSLALGSIEIAVSSPCIPLPTSTSERGLNIPALVTTTTKKGDRAGNVSGTKKKKDGSSKAAAKPKPPKPRANPGPKPKAKNTAHGSKLTPTGKGAKGSSFPSAIPATVRTSASAGASRSRSASVMPHGPEDNAVMELEDMEVDVDGEDKDADDDKLYCVCKTRYDEDRVMIACDRCDEWYHTQCVNMPDLEVDLVDQFICPPCIEKNIELSLKTTYKRRCLLGLKHVDPSSAIACHKPARGVFSKYCSDDCGIKYMQSRIDEWVKKGGKRGKLWESVKGAEKREGVVVCAEEWDTLSKKELVETGVTGVKEEVIPTMEAKPKTSKVERDIQRLNPQLDRVVRLREQIKQEMEVVLWRKRLLELATQRVEGVDECGWDQRLCFGDEEWADFGAEVLESYEIGHTSSEGDTIHSGAGEGDGEWWCTGKKKCERHLGWQGLRSKDAALETQKKEELLLKLTSQEREIRKHIEDMDYRGRDTKDRPKKTQNVVPFNGKGNLHGTLPKKGKRRKNQ